jgi:hypothetical protein
MASLAVMQTWQHLMWHEYFLSTAIVYEVMKTSNGINPFVLFNHAAGLYCHFASQLHQHDKFGYNTNTEAP